MKIFFAMDVDQISIFHYCCFCFLIFPSKERFFLEYHTETETEMFELHKNASKYC